MNIFASARKFKENRRLSKRKEELIHIVSESPHRARFR